MPNIEQLLRENVKAVCSIRPDATVFDAISKMADNDIGSLVVMDGEHLVGIITERHYARNIMLKGRTSPTTPVGDVMEKRVICSRPEQTVEQCMALMRDKRVRYLPVLEGKKVIGIVSIGDIVTNIMSNQEFTIEQLEHHIHG